jgi:hypothetical protein
MRVLVIETVYMVAADMGIDVTLVNPDFRFRSRTL